jgi:hypothetical protein
VVAEGRAGLEREVREGDAEEEPGAELRVDQAGVLPDEAEPRPGGVGALLDRPRVDVGERLDRVPRERGECVGERAEPRAEHSVESSPCA